MQFVHRWSCAEPADVVRRFDFTISMAAVWCGKSGWQSAVDHRFYEDVRDRRLVYCSPRRLEDAGGSLARVLKFYGRGYKISVHSLGMVVARLTSALGDQPADEDDRHLREVQVGRRLAELLLQVDLGSDPNSPLGPLVFPGEKAEDGGPSRGNATNEEENESHGQD